METIVKELEVPVPLEAVWSALTDPDGINGWMGSDSALFTAEVGQPFALFAGETTGQVTEVKAPNRLAYTWRQSSWPAEWADSQVVWELRDEEGITQIRLLHSGFPNEGERNSHDEGWDVHWLGPMVAYLIGRL